MNEAFIKCFSYVLLYTQRTLQSSHEITWVNWRNDAVEEGRIIYTIFT